MDHIVVGSMEDFIDKVKAVVGDSAHGRLAAFRGACDATLSLVPGIVWRFGPHSVATAPKDKSLERRLLKVFSDHAVPFLPEWTWIGGESEVLWKHVVLAQHYGLKTRLLDWTTNPLVALYFAVTGADPKNCDEACSHSSAGAGHSGRHLSAVFLLKNRDTFSVQSMAKREENADPPRYGGKRDPGIIRPPAIDGRIVAQRGLFTVSANPNDPIIPDFAFFIRQGERKTIARQLNLCGVNRMSMFPDLPSVAEYVNWDADYWV